MGLQIARVLVLTDAPVDYNTFAFGGTDRIDVVAIGADVAVEISDRNDAFTGGPLQVQAGTEESINGLATAYPDTNGARRFRLYNWTPGAAAQARLRAWGV